MTIHYGVGSTFCGPFLKKLAKEITHLFRFHFEANILDSRKDLIIEAKTVPAVDDSVTDPLKIIHVYAICQNKIICKFNSFLYDFEIVYRVLYAYGNC